MGKNKPADISNIKGDYGLKMCLWYLVQASMEVILLDSM